MRAIKKIKQKTFKASVSYALTYVASCSEEYDTDSYNRFRQRIYDADICLQKKLRQKTPPIFPYSFEKPRETGVRGPYGAHTFCGVNREFFFFDFKDMSGKGTITISGLSS
jgi:hypothetical protein